MRLVWGLDEPVAAFVAQRFDLAVERGGFNLWRAVGIADEAGILVAGIVLSDWRGFDAKLSIWAERAGFLTRPIIREMCRVAFREWGLKRLTAEMAKSNRRARRFVERAGFRLEGTLKHGWHDGTQDMCIYAMTYDNCRWLK